MTWDNNATKRFSRHAVQPVGAGPEWSPPSLHWAYSPPSKARMGGESPLRRLDRPHMGVRQGDRVYVRGAERHGFGTAVGPITSDNEGTWFVHFDNDHEDCFDYHKIIKAFEG